MPTTPSRSTSATAVAHDPRRLLRLLLAVALVGGFLTTLSPPPVEAQSVEPWQQTLEITFPTDHNAVRFSDTYTACRSGCARIHQATDIMGPRMTPLYAATDGRVCSINDEAQEDSYGRNITICGDDGNRYRYLHVNNDTPGTDDGRADLQYVYPPGIARNVRVAAGQLIAYMGDSGNAEGTAPHLHFDVYVPGVTNPYGEERINPFPSLMAALAAGRVSDGTAVLREPTSRLAGDDRVETAALVSRNTFSRADTVLLASSQVPHDALVAGPLAAVLGGPVLLTPTGGLHEATAEEIDRLRAERVVLVGEVGMLAEQLAMAFGDITIETVGSDDRFDTSARVAQLVWELTGAVDGDDGGLPDLPDLPDVREPLDLLDLADVEDLLLGDDPTILLQLTDDKQGPTALLDDAVLSSDDVQGGRLRAWVVGVDPERVERIRFDLDGETVNRERFWPYDLSGSKGNGVSLPGVGVHELEADIKYLDGSRDDVVARFEVVDATGGGGPIEEPSGVKRAIIAKGADPDPSRSWPDALAASWYGAARRLPVLLTDSTGLPKATAEALDGVEEVLVAGGPGAIGADQLDLVEFLTGIRPERLFGDDRYATAAAIADDLWGRRLATTETIHVATGANWPDAVTAGAALARDRGTLLLVDPGGASEAVRNVVRDLADDIDRVVALGGPSAVPTDALKNVAAWAV